MRFHAFFRRMAALALCICLLCSTVLAAPVMGERIYSHTVPIGHGVSLTRAVSWSDAKSDLVTENYVIFDPSSGGASPQVFYGASVPEKNTVYTMSKLLESAGKRVLAGINGDYFVMSTGSPLGLVVSDGVLRSSSSFLSALGFRADGTALIGKPGLHMFADFHGYSLEIADINKNRNGEGYFLYTEDFGETTQNTQAGIDVVLLPIAENLGQAVSGADGHPTLTRSDRLGIGKMVSCRVDQVIRAGGATPIPKGGMILSATDGNDWLQEALMALSPGDRLDIEVYSDDTRWEEVTCAVGSLYPLMEKGVISDKLEPPSYAPRTAVGVKPNGTVIFYTIDGRQKGLSIGATMQLVAQRLAELGCADAVLMDGGGSTTMVATYPDKDLTSMINSPSEGTPRAVTNGIMLVSKLSPTGKPGFLHVIPAGLLLLAGSSVQCSVSPLDSGWYPMETLPGDLTWSAEEGTVNAEGLFTPPAKNGIYAVSAASGSTTGSARVQVIEVPDAMSLRNSATGQTVSALTLAPKEEVELTVKTSYRGLPLTSQDTCFTWQADPAVGKVSENGNFVASKHPASGSLTVSIGEKSITIPVSVEIPTPFTDIKGHWAAGLIAELYAQGVVQGSSVNGKTCFHPDHSITRGDFALMTARWLNLDLEKYEHASLPHVDAGAIPEWDAKAVKALFHLGILEGSLDSRGRMRINAEKPISRAEAMTLLDRMRAEEHSDAVLSQYTDADAIPVWARAHIASLVERGVVSGFEGQLRPGASISRAEVAKLLLLLTE